MKGGVRGRVEEREEEAPRGGGEDGARKWGGMDVVSLKARSAHYRLGEQGRLQVGRLSAYNGILKWPAWG